MITSISSFILEINTKAFNELHVLICRNSVDMLISSNETNNSVEMNVKKVVSFCTNGVNLFLYKSKKIVDI